MKEYLKLFRVKHYIKNLLIFLPLFFSQSIFNKDLLFLDLLGFIIFSITSSIIYIINDIMDIEKDKLHPIKKNRPLASGKISIKQAKICEIFLVIIFILLNIITSYFTHKITSIIIPIIYFIINILYSKKLKEIPIVDVAIISFGFLLRVYYGSVLIDVMLSNWLYLTIMFGAFYLGFGKRRNEIIQNGIKSRKSLKLYNKEFLDKNMYVCLSLAVMSYSMWCIVPNVVANVGNNYLIYTVPLIMIILQMYSLIIENGSHGDPIEVVLSHKSIIFLILLYIVILFLIIYVL